MGKHWVLVLCAVNADEVSDSQKPLSVCAQRERGVRNRVCQGKSFYPQPDSLPTFCIKLSVPGMRSQGTAPDTI